MAVVRCWILFPLSGPLESFSRGGLISNLIFKNNYFLPCSLFVAARRLSLLAVSRGYSLVGVHRLLLLGNTGSRCLAAHSKWDFPGSGIEPMSPALAGGFLTHGPPGKPPIVDILTSRCLLGTSLAVPWLRFHTSTTEGTRVRPLIREVPHTTRQSQKLLKRCL